MKPYPPICELIPHAGPMVLLDALTAWEPGKARCSLTIREGTPCVRAGWVDGVATLEHMAQAVAACLGYEALLGGEGPRVGMVIGCKRFRLHQPRLAVGDRGVIEVQRVRGNQTLSHFECQLTRDTLPCAQGLLTLFHGEPPCS